MIFFFRKHMTTKSVKIPLERTGTLAKHGYHLKDADASSRRQALCDAMREYGGGYVVRKLNVLAIYRKNARRGTAMWNQFRRAENDKTWLQRVRRGMSPAERRENVARYRSYRQGKRVKKHEN